MCIQLRFNTGFLAPQYIAIFALPFREAKGQQATSIWPRLIHFGLRWRSDA
jgi:hypothetical protein